jgi:hypothetical protein
MFWYVIPDPVGAMRVALPLYSQSRACDVTSPSIDIPIVQHVNICEPVAHIVVKLLGPLKILIDSSYQQTFHQPRLDPNFL